MRLILFPVLILFMTYPSWTQASPGPHEMKPLYTRVAGVPLYKHTSEISELLYRIPLGELVMWGGDQADLPAIGSTEENTVSVTWYYVVTFHGKTGWVRAENLTDSPDFLAGYGFEQFAAHFPDMELPLEIKGVDLLPVWEKRRDEPRLNPNLGLKFLCTANPEYCVGSSGLVLPDRFLPYGKFKIGDGLSGYILFDHADGRVLLEVLVYDMAGKFLGHRLLADCHDGYEFMSNGTITKELTIEGIQIIGAYGASGNYILEQMTRSRHRISPETGEIRAEIEDEGVNQPGPFIPGPTGGGK